MIKIENLSKYYGHNIALDNLSFTIEPKGITGFLGPNGAGKSTTMNIITGYLAPSSGHVLIDGLSILDHPIEVRKKIGYLPEHPPLYEEMTVMEYLCFVAELKGLKLRTYRSEIDIICEQVHIEHVRGRLIMNLSKGYKQRIGLAAALIGRPPILILDEPTVGLDPRQILEMRTLILSFKEAHTVILSSHILPEVEAVCDSALIINKGKLIAFDTPANLSKQLHATHKIITRLAGSELLLIHTLKRRLAGYIVESLGCQEKGTVDFLISHTHQHDIRSVVFNTLIQLHLTVLSFKPVQAGLEASFLALIEQESG